MICFICEKPIVGAHFCYGKKSLPHHINCIPEVFLVASEMVLKEKNVEHFAKQSIENPDDVIESSIIGEIDEI